MRNADIGIWDVTDYLLIDFVATQCKVFLQSSM